VRRFLGDLFGDLFEQNTHVLYLYACLPIGDTYKQTHPRACQSLVTKDGITMRRDCPSVVIMTIRVPTFPPNEPDGWQRLRRLLKALVRSYGMKCESIEPKQVDEPGRKNDEDS
jgi:hypothetical protein